MESGPYFAPPLLLHLVALSVELCFEPRLSSSSRAELFAKRLELDKSLTKSSTRARGGFIAFLLITMVPNRKNGAKSQWLM